MIRRFPHVDGSVAVRFASAAGAAALSAVILGSLVGAMAPAGQDAAYVAATEVSIEPARIEVVAERAATIARRAARVG